jgi:CheY-like chemotaxis protein
MKVLIADHDPVSRRLFGLLFGKWGHDVTTARDYRGALHMLQPSEAPSLLISDTMIPDADGLKLCHKIRGTERCENIYFVYYYSKGSKEGNDQMLQGPCRCVCGQAS